MTADDDAARRGPANDRGGRHGTTRTGWRQQRTARYDEELPATAVVELLACGRQWWLRSQWSAGMADAGCAGEL